MGESTVNSVEDEKQQKLESTEKITQRLSEKVQSISKLLNHALDLEDMLAYSRDAYPYYNSTHYHDDACYLTTARDDIDTHLDALDQGLTLSQG